MPLLSICMPTRRNFEASRRAIEEALAFAEARDARVVLSDNSGDREKRVYWEKRSPRIVYHQSRAETAFQNFLEAVTVADTEFTLVLGDDDGLGFDDAVPAVDLASLPADAMGVRPLTEVYATGTGVLRRKDFGIEALTPGERIREYSRKSHGDNSAFYSIFRREPYRDLLALFVERHPIKGSFIDWALSLALFAYGRMPYDPGVIYRYNEDQWATVGLTQAANAKAFAAAGLPPHTDLYQPLLMAVDLFIFVGRPGTPLSRQEALDAVSVAAGDLLNGFLNQVVVRPDRFPPRIRYLAELAMPERDVFSRFQLALVMLDDLKPGLKDAYADFFRSTMQG